MLRHYLKTSLRYLLKHKYYSLINIFGLALGITCVFLILQYLQREFTYDRFHAGAENIYRVTWENDNPQTRTPHPLAQAMVLDFPEVENAVSLTPLWGPGLTRQTFSIRNEEKDIQYDEKGVLAVDSTFFKVFSFPLVKGDAKQVLKKIGGILLSEKAAYKYFGDEDPIGKFLSVNNDQVLIEVVGVFKDVPELSHFHFDFLVSYVREKALEDPEDKFYTWSDFGHYNYVKLKPGADARQLESRLTEWLKKYVNWSANDFRSLAENNHGLKLQRITDIHLQSHLRWELEANGNVEYVYMMIAAALLILIIGSINFINLTTAQSAERAKEIGVRKTLGAFRKQLVIQFTGESVLVALSAVLISIVLIEVSLPLLHLVTDQSWHFSITSLVIVLLAIGLLTGVVAGIYPSLYLSGVKPTAILKGKLLQSPKGALLRKVFITFQFSASMVLICASVIIYNQLNSIKHRSLGFDQEEVVIIPVKNQDALKNRFSELQHEVGKVAGIVQVSATSNIPGRSFNQHNLYPVSNPENDIDASDVMMDYDLLKVLNIDLAEGRTFLRDNPADLKHSFLLNETAARNLNITDPLGKEITWNRDGRFITGNVVGIVKDFHFQSLHQEVKPLLFKLEKNGFNYIVAKVNTADFDKTMKEIEQVWRKFDNRFSFEFFFLSDSLNQQYVAEARMAQVIIAFAAIAILIACFGLLGIAALTFQNKTKEISIRKVLGAEYIGLVVMLLKEFTVYILIAIAVATPVAVWMMNSWLQNFSYKINLNPLIFIGSGLLLLCIAWGTLGYLTLRVARVNPATTLKNE
jgi:putative ABC transport system permease protein